MTPPGWSWSMPGATSADRTSDAEVGRRPIRARLLSVVLRPTAPPLALGVVVAASFIIAETLLVYLLTKIVPEMAFGVVFLPVALLANILAGQARLRAAEANQRRREAEARGERERRSR